MVEKFLNKILDKITRPLVSLFSMDKLFHKLLAVGALIGTTLIAILSPDLIESLIKHVSAAGQSQFARDCFIFSLAALIHAGRMKREIRSNFEALTVSIDRVAMAFHDDLKNHSDRQEKALTEVHDDLKTYGEKLDKVSGRVSTLESSINTKLGDNIT